MLTSSTPLNDETRPADPPRPSSDRHAVEAAHIEALGADEVAELFARAGGQPSPSPGLTDARLEEVTQVKAILDLLMVALEKDSGLDSRLQEQILALICDIEAKVADALDAESSDAGPDLSAVKRLLLQLVKVIERSRAASAKPAPPVELPAEPVSLESEIMAELASASPATPEDKPEAWSFETLVDEVWSDDEAKPATPAPETAEPDRPAEPQAKAAEVPSDDPAMSALYDSLKPTTPPLLEQTAAGDIEVVSTELPPPNLPKCLTEPWDEKAAKTKAKAAAPGGPGVATRTTRALFAPLGRLGRRFKKDPAKQAAEKKAPAKSTKKTKKSKKT